jgi:hypothetical protein
VLDDLPAAKWLTRAIILSIPEMWLQVCRAERVRVDGGICAEPHVVSALEHEMTGGKDGARLQGYGQRRQKFVFCNVPLFGVWPLRDPALDDGFVYFCFTSVQLFAF